MRFADWINKIIPGPGWFWGLVAGFVWITGAVGWAASHEPWLAIISAVIGGASIYAAGWLLERERRGA